MTVRLRGMLVGIMSPTIQGQFRFGSEAVPCADGRFGENRVRGRDAKTGDVIGYSPQA